MLRAYHKVGKKSCTYIGWRRRTAEILKKGMCFYIAIVAALVHKAEVVKHVIVEDDICTYACDKYDRYRAE